MYFLGWLFGLAFVDQHIDKEIVLDSSNIILNDEKQKIMDIRLAYYILYCTNYMKL